MKKLAALLLLTLNFYSSFGQESYLELTSKRNVSYRIIDYKLKSTPTKIMTNSSYFKVREVLMNGKRYFFLKIFSITGTNDDFSIEISESELELILENIKLLKVQSEIDSKKYIDKENNSILFNSELKDNAKDVQNFYISPSGCNIGYSIGNSKTNWTLSIETPMNVRTFFIKDYEQLELMFSDSISKINELRKGSD